MGVFGHSSRWSTLGELTHQHRPRMPGLESLLWFIPKMFCQVEALCRTVLPHQMDSSMCSWPLLRSLVHSYFRTGRDHSWTFPKDLGTEDCLKCLCHDNMSSFHCNQGAILPKNSSTPWSSVNQTLNLKECRQVIAILLAMSIGSLDRET